jgi:glycosyltransferase involved in cell wall biosynthesis
MLAPARYRQVPKTLIFSPFLHTLGGGERVTFALAEWLSTKSSVQLAGKVIPSRDRLVAFGFPDLPIAEMSYAEALAQARHYDVFVLFEVRPPGRPRGRRTTCFCVVQFPFRSRAPLLRRDLKGTRKKAAALRLALRQRIALRRYSYVTYSEFCADWVAARWRRTAHLLHPPVQLRPWEPDRKMPHILSVGRFVDPASGGHLKRQDALVDAFERFLELVGPEWTLTLAGACSNFPEDEAYVESLKKRAAGLPVRFAVNAPAATLNDLFQTATLFWQATGLSRPQDEPERAEHFGISTVEAMSAGCVPLVYGDGGPVRIVGDPGLLWRDLDELAFRSADLVNDPERLSRLAATMHERADRYSPDAFAASCERIFQPVAAWND